MESDIDSSEQTGETVLALVPNLLLIEIAKHEDVSISAVVASARRLGVALVASPTGRKRVRPADGVRIARDLRSKLKVR